MIRRLWPCAARSALYDFAWQAGYIRRAQSFLWPCAKLVRKEGCSGLLLLISWQGRYFTLSTSAQYDRPCFCDAFSIDGEVPAASAMPFAWRLRCFLYLIKKLVARAATRIAASLVRATYSAHGASHMNFAWRDKLYFHMVASQHVLRSCENIYDAYDKLNDTIYRCYPQMRESLI